jgi:hypothetical protein
MGPCFRRDDGERERFVTQPLLIEHDDGVDRVTFNRPESLNISVDAGSMEAVRPHPGSVQPFGRFQRRHQGLP